MLTDTLKVGTLIVTLALASGTAMLAARSASAQDSGAALFASDCARCHGDALEGGEGPPLAGPGNAIGTYKTAGALLQYAMENMPTISRQLAPGEIFGAIIAFILSKHGVTVPEAFDPENGAAIVLP